MSKKTTNSKAAASSSAGDESQSHAQLGFKQLASDVLQELQKAVTALVKALVGEIDKAVDIERAFEIEHPLGWRVYRIVVAPNPFAVAQHVPVHAAMQRLLKSATRHRVPASVVQRVANAYSEFETLLSEHAEDRDELEAMLGTLQPDTRYKQELVSRKAAFKAMSQIKGLTVDTEIGVFFLHPTPDGQAVDRAALTYNFGLRWIRHDARLVFVSGDVTKPDTSILTLDGRPCNDPLASVLNEFSTPARFKFETQQIKGVTYYHLVSHEIGQQSAIDLVNADRHAMPMPRYWEPGMPHRIRGNTHLIDIPTKRCISDVFVHKDVYPGVVPQAIVYDTAFRGVVSVFNDPTREDDRMSLHETIRPLRAGLAAAKVPHVPRYIELLKFACRTLGWNPAHFLGYRLDIQYPVYGSQYLIGFELPSALDQPEG